MVDPVRQVHRIGPEAVEEWDRFVEASPDGTAFSSTGFLESLRSPYSLYAIRRHGQIEAGAVCLEDPGDQGSMLSAPSPFVPYHGFCFRAGESGESRRRTGVRRSRDSVELLDAVARDYRMIRFAHCWTVIDVRPFNWFNSAAEGGETPRFRTDVWYTSILPLGEASNERVQRYDVTRRHRKALKMGVSTQLVTDMDRSTKELLAMYVASFQRQAIAIPGDHLDRLSSIVGWVHAAGTGRCFVSYLGGSPVAASLVLVDSKRAYYLAGGTSQEGFACGAAVSHLVTSLELLGEHGVKEVDLLGINSPSRAHFKLGFGGSITPYYVSHLDSR